jgi:hypothetical protein
MLLIDDLLAAPLRGLFFILREVGAAVQSEREEQHLRVVAELADLHRQLDGGRITEAEFEVREDRLLQQLDSMRGENVTNGGSDGHD